MIFYLKGTLSRCQQSCSGEYEEDNFNYLFPNLWGNRNPDPSLWQDSMQGVSYVYPIPSEVNCSGDITGIQFCYRTSNTAIQQVFNFLILSISDSYVDVLESIALNSTDKNSTSMNPGMNNSSDDTNICMSFNDTIFYCCDTVVFERYMFQFPSKNLAIGITISTSTESILQEFHESYSQNYNVSSYFVNTNLMEGSTYNFTNAIFSNETIHVIRLLIGKIKFSNYSYAASITFQGYPWQIWHIQYITYILTILI